MAWRAGFAFFAFALVACGYRLHTQTPTLKSNEESKGLRAGETVSRGRILRWVVWAFLPSSLMLGVTQHLTTDIASIPLLWVVPLALYLLTFILAFAKSARRVPTGFIPVVPFLVLAVTCEFGLDAPQFLLMGLHLLVFFLFSLLFHGFLADDRPDASHVTRYFLWVSVGGALGGIFHGLVAPWIFDRPIEYALGLAVAIAILPVGTIDPYRPHRTPYFVVAAGLVYLFCVDVIAFRISVFALATVVSAGVFGVTRRYPKAAYWMLAAIFLLGVAQLQSTRGALGHERSFFGSYKIFERSWRGETVRKFSHGTTSHGSQAVGEELRRKPLSYHHRSGPVGEIFEELEPNQTGVVGLGAGAMAAYANPDTEIVFYEIDPLVERIAREYFWYLRDCGDRCKVKLGDGRLLLAQEAENTFDLLFLDAYNSDSVPTHLLSREALRLYVQRVKPSGGIVFHVSNRYLDIQSVVGSLALDAGMTCLSRTHFPSLAERRDGAMTSSYAVVGTGEWMEKVFDSKWRPCRSDAPVWTDDFSNVLHVFRWR
jgi:SAM-dependent methyltransferase